MHTRMDWLFTYGVRRRLVAPICFFQTNALLYFELDLDSVRSLSTTTFPPQSTEQMGGEPL